MAEETLGPVPYYILLNKVDLVSEWVVGEREERQLAEEGNIICTSAKTGQGVEEAFQKLTRSMLHSQRTE